MEAEMIVNPIPMQSNVTTDQVIQLLDTLYNSRNPAEQSEANVRLMELQSSDQVWNICWLLLDPNNCLSVEVHFFAANALLNKINQSWAQQEEDWLQNHLRPKLFEILVSYAATANAGKLAVERLSLALATFALHSIPTFWPDAIENILQTFTPQNLRVTISPQRICDILLKILMYIPEEYSVLMPSQNHKAKLNEQMTKSGPIVFKFLHSLLIADNSAVTTECRQNILKCLTSWTMHSRTSLLELDDNRPILDLLYDLIMDDELCSSACSTLGVTFNDQKAENYRNTVIDFIPKIANLKQIIDKHMQNDDVELAIKIYSLLGNFSENHSKVFLKIILEDGIHLEKEKADRTKQAIFTIIRIILDCTSAPGIYGVDEKYSDLAFTFWFVFFENFYYYPESHNDVICETFDPLVDSLLQTLISKSQYPSSAVYSQIWNDDQREAYRCYRQDLGDNISLIIHFPRARDRIIRRLYEQLEQQLTLLVQSKPTNGERSWQGFESVVFALKSVAESIPFDEELYVHKIFAILSQTPFAESHPLLYCTVAEMLSAYSDWLFTHSSHLAVAFNILFLGINSLDSHVRLMSTLSLKDLTSECQTVLQPFASQIVKSCTDAVLQPSSRLSTNEKSRLTYTIGTTLATLNAALVKPSLNTLTIPLICELNAKAQTDPTIDPTCRAIVLDRLTMLNSLIESLYVKQYSGNEYEDGDIDENDCPLFDPARYDVVDEIEITQPLIELLKQMIPVLNVIVEKYRSDEDIMEMISNTIKRSAKSLGIDVKPVLKELLMLVFNAYDPILSSGILDGAMPLYMLFKVDKSLQQFLMEVFLKISEKTVGVCIANPLRQMSLTMENYFRFATCVGKKFPDFLTKNTVQAEYIFKLAIASLELPEKRTLCEVTSFLIVFRGKSSGHDQLNAILLANLNVLLDNIFNIFGGNYLTPRNALDCATDLLYHIIEMDEAKEPLKRIAERENFPTNHVNREQKARFVSRIIHEKNRRKYKDACAEFVLVARNLNRST